MRDIKLLLVEDNPADARLIQKLLIASQAAEFTVVCATTMQQATAEVAGVTFDAILSDLTLPDSSGIETFLTIKSRCKNVPIIVLTGLDDQTVAIDAVQNGAQDYLVKGDLRANWLGRAVLHAIDRFAAAQRISELNDELVAARDAAMAAANFKAQFLATMSHELRTPLNAVLGAMELLNRTQLTAAQEKLLKLSLNAGRSLLATINDVLLISKLEAGKFTLQTNSFDLRALVLEAVELNTITADKKGLRIIVDLSPAFPAQIEGDAQRLKQILLNLVSNAVKFTHHGSVTVSAATEGEMVVVKVKDTGPGLAPEALASLFSRYRQSEATEAQNSLGTGLGLTISKELLELMGGTIGADSEERVGSTFWFSFPLTIAQSKQDVNLSGTADDAGTSKQFKAKVLVVDDNQINQEVMALQLETFGVSPTFASNGLESVNRLTTESFDIVFMDYQMPVMDGLTATREIRKIDARLGRHTLIIALTANVMESQREECLQAGMDQYLAKPISLSELEFILENHAEQKVITQSAVAKQPAVGVVSSSGGTSFDLAALKNEYGAPTATRLARLFCQRAAELLELMRQQDPRVNGEVMKKQVHELKGQASVLGFQTIGGLCLKLKEQLEGNLEKVNVYLSELERELQILQNELLLVESL